MKKTRTDALRISVAAVGLMLAIAAASSPAQAADNSACTACHDQGAKLGKSGHAEVACASCHVKHDEYPHPANIPKPACSQCHQGQEADYEKGVHGQAVKHGNAAAPDCGVCHGAAHELVPPKSADFRGKVPETCGMCHSEVAEQFNKSVHGQALARGITQAPVCTDCHGEHSILAPTNKASPVHADNIRDTCANCHGNVQLSRRFGLPSDRVVSFDASFHGLAAKEGSQTVANCASCHGVHNILPSADPHSTINPRNLAATCGKCHQGAGKRFAISQVHVAQGRAEAPAMRWVRQFYLLLIPLTIGLMLLHNGGDWVRKLLRLRSPGAEARPSFRDELPGRPDVRMLPFERVQHALLVLSFATLVWTGFALKYPDQWWARPLMLREGNLRSIVHRIAAVVFMAVTLTHGISLIANRRLRRHWMQLFPKAADAREALANFSYNVGLRSAPPGRSAHSYIEKAEYWAVVWGALVMILTGVMLWGNNLMLALFPKSWLDVATSVHFYEALLATLAIVVWHLYGVIFDPDVYPMDTAWLTGVSVKEPESSEQPPARHRAQPIEAGASHTIPK
ncbi:MAG TPA: cytochrome b/b6 domain-containing protein [Bryobacteraceae bacterium]|nr:cytochrome b/b6 domain-containing protein [Bryobacteraceae bacterium]